MFSAAARASSRFSASALLAAAAAGTVAWNTYGTQGLTAEADAKKPQAKPQTQGLDPNEFRPFKLLEKEKLTHNTFRFRFELPSDRTAGLPVASCLLTKAMLAEKPGDKPKAVIRPYTPVSPADARGYLDLVVKVYPKGVMSKHFGSLKVGDTLDMKGPIPKYPYTPNTKNHIGMIAGGTGIAPMLQVAEHILHNPSDRTEVTLVFANVSPKDIMLKGRIDALAAKYKARFHVHYVVDKRGWLNVPGWFWKGGVGYITKDMIKQHMPPPKPENMVFVCGPPGMMNLVSGPKAPDYTQGPVDGLLKELGYTSNMVFKF